LVANYVSINKLKTDVSKYEQIAYWFISVYAQLCDRQLFGQYTRLCSIIFFRS